MRTAAAVTILCLAATGAGATPGGLAAELAGRGAPPRVAVSICFAPVCGTGPRVALDGDRPLPPASVQKIVTSAAALDLLGPDRTFETRVRADGPIRAPRLEGNLYLEGDGDPFLVSERLWLLAQDLAATGLREVAGSLFVNAGRVADLDSIRAAERTDSPYASPVSLVGVNFNNLCFLVRPGPRAGAPAVVYPDPFPVEGVSIENQVRTGPGEPLELIRTKLKAGERWTLRGAVATGSPPERIYRAAGEPAPLAGSVLKGLLGEAGVTIGPVEEGRAPRDAPVVASLPSLPLGALMRGMNGYSNNFMADLLLADMGEGSARAGVERVRGWLANVVGMQSLPTIRDGSGLSAANRISAQQIVDVLVWASRSERVFPDLYASLPRPHGSGTLERRFRVSAAPALRAKTGTLGDRGVSSIAGYVDTAAGERYAFCIIQQASPEAGLKVADLRAREEGWLRLFTEP
jgi:D-alanyl-D-alanine carboxypeptidase/D-alanyl-D-alanine-endopeptidase (penicillin-binding protein 4)